MTTTTPAISVTGVTVAHAKRAIKFLRNRNMLSFYRRDDKSLNAFITKHGAEQTETALRNALEQTRN